MFNGATVMLEHRFYGFSNPVEDLNGTTLAKYHTIEQAVADLEYFAKNVELPMEGGDEVAPGMVPWILSGCSYMGALTAWTMHEYVFLPGVPFLDGPRVLICEIDRKPGLFHAGWSSSAPVQPI